MKKTILTVFIIGLLGSSSWAMAPSSQKLVRGVSNIITSPVEIVKQTRYYWIEGSTKTYHISAWLFCGFVKGLVMTVARIGSGVWDIVSFPFPSQSLVQPSCVFADWPHRQPGVVYHQLGQ